MAIVCAHVLIAGNVQGVAFRYYTNRLAERLGLAGWVMNLPDGKVEALFQGEEENVREILEWCHEGPSTASVRSVDIEWMVTEQSICGFSVY